MPNHNTGSRSAKYSSGATPIYQVTIEGYINYQKNPAKCLQDSGKYVSLLLRTDALASNKSTYYTLDKALLLCPLLLMQLCRFAKLNRGNAFFIALLY